MSKFGMGTLFALVGWFIGALFGAIFFGEDLIPLFWTIGAIAGFLYGIVKTSEDAKLSDVPSDLCTSEIVEIAAMPNSSAQQRPRGNYRDVMPELIAACISADGEITEAKINLATDLLADDDRISDKVSALEALQTHLKVLAEARETAKAIYRLKVNTVIQKALTIRNERERHSGLRILYGMLGAAEGKTGNELKNLVNTVGKAWTKLRNQARE
jgi:predicted lipid-binding transport protein (Tim44 family)